MRLGVLGRVFLVFPRAKRRSPRRQPVVFYFGRISHIPVELGFISSTEILLALML